LKRKPTHPLLILMIVLFGLLLMLPDFDRTWAGFPDDTWPTAEATVVASEVETHTDYNSASHTSETRHIARITFRYQYQGTSYDSAWWHSDGSRSFDDRREAQAAVDASPVGARLVAHVNPKVPSRAVVDTTAPSDYGVWFVRGGAVLGLALLMLITEFVQRRRASNRPS